VSARACSSTLRLTLAINWDENAYGGGEEEVLILLRSLGMMDNNMTLAMALRNKSRYPN
jgi:hypothetical protein